MASVYGFLTCLLLLLWNTNPAFGLSRTQAGRQPSPRAENLRPRRDVWANYQAMYPTAATSGAHQHNSYGTSANFSIFNVLDFGAVGDGKTDNFKAFQNALNAAATGGIVFVPPGQFAFLQNSTLTVPRGATLQGTYSTVPSHGVHDGSKPDVGSVLLPSGGRGSEDGCFIELSEDTTVAGLTIFYPDQLPQQVPQPYPWSLCLHGNNAAVTDIECLNCWNAVRAVAAARHYIARIQGQPINTGIYVDETYDIGRVEDVHWNPWYASDVTFMSWQLLHGRAFVFARTDWEYVLNTFAFGYAIGYHFIASKEGSCNGNFLGIGADMAANASVQVDASDPMGILITNGEFTAFVDPQFGTQYADSTQVVITAANKGAVSFSNSAFWGPANQIAKISGSGTTSFADCIFNKWDHDKKGNSAIEVENATGSLLVRGCDFQYPASQVDLGSTLKKAVITGNIISGSTNITGKAMNTQIGMNADDNPS